MTVLAGSSGIGGMMASNEEPMERVLQPLDQATGTDFHEAIAGIQQGMDDFAAGRWIFLEDYEADILERRHVRDAVKDDR